MNESLGNDVVVVICNWCWLHLIGDVLGLFLVHLRSDCGENVRNCLMLLFICPRI